jgi:2-polyprenyl-3-methyl-5-hydroxy-6-metoxy-1,4-benzoquinol methylase
VTVTAVDRSASAIDAARARGLERARFVVADVTTFEPDDGPYAHVVAAHLVNELDDPVAFLTRCAQWLAPGALLHVAVANARSVHRLVAVEMGLLDDLAAPSAGLARFSAGALLDADGLVALGAAAGLRCTHREPVLLKPLPNARMAELPDELIRGLDAVAHHFPEHGGVNYAIFQP